MKLLGKANSHSKCFASNLERITVGKSIQTWYSEVIGSDRSIYINKIILVAIRDIITLERMDQFT